MIPTKTIHFTGQAISATKTYVKSSNSDQAAVDTKRNEHKM